MKAYIYALRSPITNRIRYIGKANDIQKRFESHIRDSRMGGTPVKCWIKSLSTKPIIEVLEECSQDTWQEAERRLIAEYRITHKDLLNIANGGNEPKIKDKHIHELQKRVGQYIAWAKKNNRPLTHKFVASLRYASNKRPDIFGKYALL